MTFVFVLLMVIVKRHYFYGGKRILSILRYEIEIRKRAEKDLALIPKSDAQRIADAIFAMENGLIGDIKKLSNYFPEYRLRVGNWRILFDLSKNKITIYRIINRKEAYR